MNDSDQIAVDIIVDVIQKISGYDFHHYAKASLKRRLLFHKEKNKFASLADIIPRLINEPNYVETLLIDISITVTEMFRDPDFYVGFLKYILPKLKTYSYVNIWHAGCSTGEEVYSMAIILHENAYLERSQLYGTDFNRYAINLAKKGIYDIKKKEHVLNNYRKCGGKLDLNECFVEKYDSLKVKRFLQNYVAFSKHDLSTDGVFNKMHVIVCRNVMIYFDDVLKENVLTLFYDSLVDGGYLCIGSKETINRVGFKLIDERACLYQKVPI